jgi:hypothetical protein
MQPSVRNLTEEKGLGEYHITHGYDAARSDSDDLSGENLLPPTILRPRIRETASAHRMKLVFAILAMLGYTALVSGMTYGMTWREARRVSKSDRQHGTRFLPCKNQ